MARITSFFQRHASATLIGGVAVVALAGGGIAYAATSSPGTDVTAPSITAPTTTPSTSVPSSGTAGHRARDHGARGTLTAISGQTWTVKTLRGPVITVTISPQTTFGTPKAPSSASAFTVGSPVAVLGDRSGTDVTATRIFAPKALGSGGSTTTVPT